VTAPRALLMDAGGTVYTEGMHPLEGRARALRRAYPGLSAVDSGRLAAALQTSTQAALRRGAQHSDAMIATVLEAFSPHDGLEARTVRDAMVESMFGATSCFDGAPELLQSARRLGLATVLVTDTSWHSEADTWARVDEMGIARHLDHVVSSFELGVRKPDPRIFWAALERAGAEASASIMVGDNEEADIAPAAAIGMATIRVTMQFPLDGRTAADATAASLVEVREIIERWCRGRAGPPGR
jgi:HAD superfamily hydrolase (TIGR01549 family)